MTGFVTLICLIILYVRCSMPNCMKSQSPQGALGLSSFDVIANFQSGSAKLVNNQNGSRYHSFNITLAQQFNISYHATISFQNIVYFEPGDGLDFFITTNMHSGYLEAMLVMDIQAKWAWVSVFFAVSFRNDFCVGIFVANNAQLLLSPPTGTVLQVHHQLPNFLNSTSEFVYALPFISGMRTYDFYMNFSFINADFNITSNILFVDMFISYQKYPLQSLYVSYLIFNIASDLEISSLIDITFIPTNINVFLGVTTVSPLQYALSNYSQPIIGLGASAAQQQAFNLMFGINGIVIQTQQSIDILYLPLSKNVTSMLTQETLYCISKSKCYEQGGVMIYQQVGIFDISQQCQICMINAYYNQIISMCICELGFTNVNGTCANSSQICNSNETYSTDLQRCICNNLYINISGVCLSLMNICPQGEIYYQGKCITIVYTLVPIPACQDGYLFINKICVQMNNCSPPMELDSATNLCQCPNNTQSVNDSCMACSVNQTWINYTCKCKRGFFLIQNQCLQCSINAYYDGVTCVCLRSYLGDGFTCTSDGSSSNSLADPTITASNSSSQISAHPP